jgi:hypothetical protein
MTLDQLIEAAQALRGEIGGSAEVLVMTKGGYAPLAHVADGLGFAGKDGPGEAIALLLPKQPAPH